MSVRGASGIVARLTAWTVAGFGIGALLLVVVPFAFGLRSMSVMSGSMAPAIGTGDVIVDEWIAPREARVGDIVTFNDRTRGGRVLTHRVTRLRHRSDQVDFVTRGDANSGVERWSAPAGGRIGRVVYRVPHAGFLMVWTRTPWGRLAFLVLPALLWAALEIFRIWRPREEAVARDAATA